MHPEILRSRELPTELIDEKVIWQEQHRSIVDLEEYLRRSAARIDEKPPDVQATLPAQKPFE